MKIIILSLAFFSFTALAFDHISNELATVRACEEFQSYGYNLSAINNVIVEERDHYLEVILSYEKDGLDCNHSVLLNPDGSLILGLPTFICINVVVE